MAYGFEPAGKNALVIASSQGLGKAVAQHLVQEGVNVMISGRDEEKLQKVQKELQQLGKAQVAYHRSDITNVEDISSLVQKTRKEYGHIDILINNAGGPTGGILNRLLMKIGRNHSN